MTQQRFIGFQSVRLNPLAGFVTLLACDRWNDESISMFTAITSSRCVFQRKLLLL